MDDVAGSGTTLNLWHRFEASPERVFDAWTRPETLRLWWCPAGWHLAEIEMDLRVGGTYRISMWRESGAQIVAVHGRFLEIQPPKRLVYTWRWDGVFPDMPETIVTVEFRALAGGTELAPRQGVLELPMCGRHLSGWLAAYEGLAEVCETRTMLDQLGASRDTANRPAAGFV